MRKFCTLAAAALAVIPTMSHAQSVGGTQGALFADPLVITPANGTTAVPQNTAGGTYGMEIEGITCLYNNYSTPLVPYPTASPPPLNLLVVHNGIPNFVTVLTAGGGSSGSYFPLTNMILTTGGYAPFADLPTDANDGHVYFPVGPGDKIELQEYHALSTGYQMNCTVWGKTFN